MHNGLLFDKSALSLVVENVNVKSEQADENPDVTVIMFTEATTNDYKSALSSFTKRTIRK